VTYLGIRFLGGVHGLSMVSLEKLGSDCTAKRYRIVSTGEPGISLAYFLPCISADRTFAASRASRSDSICLTSAG
jgi:hypothetical protein